MAKDQQLQRGSCVFLVLFGEHGSHHRKLHWRFSSIQGLLGSLFTTHVLSGDSSIGSVTQDSRWKTLPRSLL